jgi:CHAT domain-containing protein
MLKPLLYSEQEVARLRPLYPVSLLLSRQQATKRLLLQHLDSYEIVHLAAHSVVNEQNPLLSSIILSALEPADTFPAVAGGDVNLHAYEIFGLKLNRTRLVILSSCRSGLTPEPWRNGIGGLAHAFFSAQVPTVIAGLWEVDDEGTAKLMMAFHQFYRVEKKSFSQALRQAQLSLMRSHDEKWHHPFYWAAFTLSGDGFTA